MGVAHAGQIKVLEESFQSFSQLSETLENTYHRLEQRVQELHGQLAEAEQQRQAEVEAHDRISQRYNGVLNALPAGVVVLNESGRVYECNPAAMELLGEPLTGELWIDVVTRAFAPCSDDGPDISLKDGRLLSLSTCPLGDAPGQVLLLSDVTETRQLQHRLNQHQRLSAMGEMAAGIAHQIRTPLASCVLYSSQLKNQKIDETKRSELLGKVFKHMGHLEGLVNDMLLFSKTGHAGNDEIAVEVLLASLGEAIQHPCRDANITLAVSIEHGARTVIGNQRMLHSAIHNLLNNAVQAIVARNLESDHIASEISITSQAQMMGSIDISISDTGPGIDPVIQDKIFQPFFTTRSQGTGLGLSVVQAIIRAHQGEIWLDRSTSSGSRFVIRLPVMAQTANDSATCSNVHPLTKQRENQ